jgi:hypothetical protein
VLDSTWYGILEIPVLGATVRRYGAALDDQSGHQSTQQPTSRADSDLDGSVNLVCISDNNIPVHHNLRKTRVFDSVGQLSCAPDVPCPYAIGDSID